MVDSDRLDEIERELDRVTPGSGPHNPPEDPTPEELDEWYVEAVKNPEVDTERAQSRKLKKAEEQGFLTPLPEIEPMMTVTEKAAAGEAEGLATMTIDGEIGTFEQIVPADSPNAEPPFPDSASDAAQAGPADDGPEPRPDLPADVADRLDAETIDALPADVSDDVPGDLALGEIHETVRLLRKIAEYEREGWPP